MRTYLLSLVIVGALFLGSCNAISRGKVLAWTDAHPGLRGTATVLFLLGSLYNIINKPLQAREYYRRIVELYPQSRYGVDAHFEFAATFEKAKEFKQAVVEYQKFVAQRSKSKYETAVQNNISLLRSQYQ